MTDNQDLIESPPSIFQSIRQSSLGIGLFAVLSAGVIAVTQYGTREQIVDNVRTAESRALFEIYPAEIDPELYDHRVELVGRELNWSTPVHGYQVIESGQVQGVILPVRATEGYSGDIDLLVGINADGSVQGVRVVTHRETPGLGDNIELSKSDWILSFNGLERQGSDDPAWAVKKDGGQFDQFTGATITPRAVVSATATALDYFEKHPELLKSAKKEQSDE